MSVIKSYIRHRLVAKNRHEVHSPFVYDLIENVFKPRAAHNQNAIEALRQKLKTDTTPIEVNDLGAGPRKRRGARRPLSSIARQSPAPPERAAMLQRLIDYLDLPHVLELGTNLGLTTAYLASARKCRRCLSIEADPRLAQSARNHLGELSLDATVITGSFEDCLEDALAFLVRVDFAFIDGNHRFEPTLQYFKNILPHTTERSVLALGDIHWSPGMENAWKVIQEAPETTLTIDLFDLGLVFFQPDRAKQHFILRY